EPAREFTLKFRLPWWLAGSAEITVNGERQALAGGASSFVAIRRAWHEDHIQIALPYRLSAEPLPDQPDTVAFMEGPVVLAGVLANDGAISSPGWSPLNGV